MIAVPIMIMMMLIVSHKSAMGRFRATPRLMIAGWGATALMGATVVAMLVSLVMSMLN